MRYPTTPLTPQRALRVALGPGFAVGPSGRTLDLAAGAHAHRPIRRADAPRPR